MLFVAGWLATKTPCPLTTMHRNGFTIASNSPSTPIHTIVEMLGEATKFYTLNVRVGPPPVCMAILNRQKTVFLQGAKGIPSTFQATSLHPLLRQGVTIVAMFRSITLISSHMLYLCSSFSVFRSIIDSISRIAVASFLKSPHVSVLP